MNKPSCQYCHTTTKPLVRATMLRWGKETLEVMCPHSRRHECNARQMERVEANMDAWLATLSGQMRREALASIKERRKHHAAISNDTP